MTPKEVITWITLGSAIAGGTARVISIEERQSNQLNEITRLGRELQDVRGYLTAAEGRIEALEKDRVLLERIHVIEVRLGAIEARRR